MEDSHNAAMQAEMRSGRPARGSGWAWWPPVATVIVAGIAFAIALLLPRLFSDPVAVDPYLLRVAAVGVALVVAAWRFPALGRARAPLLALAAVCVPFSAWLATPSLCGLLFGDRLSYPAQLALAGGVQVACVAVCVVCSARLPAAERRPMRLGRINRASVIATTAGTAALLVLVMLLPARWLGREAIQPAMLARDGAWLVAAGSLQAAAQEVAFRGMLLAALERGGSARLANLTQAVLFGLAHLAVQYEGPAAPFVPVTLALGLWLGWLTQRTRSLWPAIVIHAVADVAVSVGVVPGLYGY